MPIIIAAFYPAVTFIHHPHPEESYKISPLSERLMVTLAHFIMHPPPCFCLVNTKHTASGSSGPPFLLLQLVRGSCRESFLLFCQVDRTTVKRSDVSYL